MSGCEGISVQRHESGGAGVVCEGESDLCVVVPCGQGCGYPTFDPRGRLSAFRRAHAHVAVHVGLRETVWVWKPTDFSHAGPSAQQKRTSALAGRQ